MLSNFCYSNPFLAHTLYNIYIDRVGSLADPVNINQNYLLYNLE